MDPTQFKKKLVKNSKLYKLLSEEGHTKQEFFNSLRDTGKFDYYTLLKIYDFYSKSSKYRYNLNKTDFLLLMDRFSFLEQKELNDFIILASYFNYDVATNSNEDLLREINRINELVEFYVEEAKEEYGYIEPDDGDEVDPLQLEMEIDEEDEEEYSSGFTYEPDDKMIEVAFFKVIIEEGTLTLFKWFYNRSEWKKEVSEYDSLNNLDVFKFLLEKREGSNFLVQLKFNDLLEKTIKSQKFDFAEVIIKEMDKRGLKINEENMSQIPFNR